jgi:hypothetical protein
VTGALPGALTLAADGKLAGRLGGQSVSTQLP